MAKPLDITDLSVAYHSDGDSIVKVWARCSTTEDIDDIISWLKLAKVMMETWKAIRTEDSP